MGLENDKSSGKMRRRDFLRDTSVVVTAGGFTAVFAQPVRMDTPTDASVFENETDALAETGTVFPQSVASGGPTPEGVLIWTRISPEAYDSIEPLGLAVAADQSFENVIHRGIINSEEIIPEHDYTVTVDIDGLLSSNDEYFYRFTYGGVRSHVGRCQTLPRSDASPESVKFAVLTCQDYQNGYYGAYSHVADENIDFLIHLGDFIYESAAGQYKAPGGKEYPDRSLVLPSGHDLAHTIEDYRYLYNTYRSDPFLQRALEQHTLIAGWDDHEIANNRYWDYETDSPKLPPYPKGDDPSFAMRVTAAGIQAWVEQMPARVEYNPEKENLHEQFVLRRRFQFGDLATLALTDERLFRDPPPSKYDGDRSKRTMLGNDQLQWFLDAIDSAQTIWNVWANEVLTMSLKIGAADAEFYLNKDAWDGYRDEREQIMQHLARDGIENFITLTSDMHSYMAGYQQTGYDLFENDKAVGVEFMTPAVTSANLAEYVPGSETLSWFDISELVVTITNPHVEFFNSRNWGYSVVEFTPEECTYTAYSVDKTVDSPNAEKRRLRTLRVPEGEVKIETIDGEE